MKPGGKIAQLLGSDGSETGHGAQHVDKDPARYRDRILALPGATALAGKTAVLVGLGSVGSCLGAHLVRLGVSTIGCDPDLLEVPNLIRWGLSANIEEHVGQPKARVWEALLAATVPDARVHGHAIDVVRQGSELKAIVEATAPDLLIAATDTADSRRMVNAMAATYGVPALFVGLSDGAASVRVEVVQDARRGPCHLCAVRAEGALPTTEGTLRSRTPYSSAEPEALTTSVPALPIDVALGALVAARVAVLLLGGFDWRAYFRHGEQQGNVLFLSLRPDWWVFEDAWERLVYQVEQDPECPACGPAGDELGAAAGIEATRGGEA